MRISEVERHRSGQGHSVYLWQIEMSQHYRHAVGSTSPFYLGMEQGLLRATRCPRCEKSWFPPRQFCDADLTETTWYDLPGTGTVVAATRVHSPPPFGGVDPPYILASIRLDGVEGGITHRVTGTEAPQKGTEVAVRFINEAPHPLLAIAFTVKERTV